VSSRRSAAESWIASLSPWPREFGLGRMRALLTRLAEPQLTYPAIHVVGTNGKSTTSLTIEVLLGREGLHVGTTVSPHVRGWSERIRIGGREADFERAIARVRDAAEAVDATQFEAITAAALAEFAEAGVDVAVVEAGLGGRLDATNVLRSPVQVLTNVAREHTEQLGETREEIAREKLAVVRPGSAVVLGEAEWEPEARRHGASTVNVAPDGNAALAVAAASLFLGRPLEPIAEVRPPGRLEQRGVEPLELWDGAHNAAGVEYLCARLPGGPPAVVVASVLADKDVAAMLGALARVGDRLIATRRTRRRRPRHRLALPAGRSVRQD
jgi:dihydrofolate synthase/folylpolyglutamate synthase